MFWVLGQLAEPEPGVTASGHPVAATVSASAAAAGAVSAGAFRKRKESPAASTAR